MKPLAVHHPGSQIGLFGSGDYRLTPIHVDDVAGICANAADGDTNVTLNAVGPETFTYREMIHQMARAMGLGRLIVPLPDFVSLLNEQRISWINQATLLAETGGLDLSTPAKIVLSFALGLGAESSSQLSVGLAQTAARESARASAFSIAAAKTGTAEAVTRSVPKVAQSTSLAHQATFKGGAARAGARTLGALTFAATAYFETQEAVAYHEQEGYVDPSLRGTVEGLARTAGGTAVGAVCAASVPGGFPTRAGAAFACYYSTSVTIGQISRSANRGAFIDTFYGASDPRDSVLFQVQDFFFGFGGTLADQLGLGGEG